MKPLIRWTFGMVKTPGEEVFHMAAKRFKSLYPEFDYAICCNNTDQDQLDRLKKLNIDIHKQKISDLDYPLMPVDSPKGWKGAMPGWGWKLCPARLRPDGHELWVDNDILIRERLPEIDEWLNSNKLIIAQGHRYDERYYGEFSHLVKGKRNFSAGLFGLPPNFDFQSRVISRCKEVLRGEPLGHFDEQGLVASIVSNNEHIVCKSVKIIKATPTKPFPKAMHFITTNRYHTHDDWGRYKCSILM